MSDIQRSKQTAAFTLVEVVIAMGIFALVIAGGFTGMKRGFDLVDSARHMTRSSQILQSELELLRTMPWGTLSTQDASELTERFNEQIAAQFGSEVYLGKVQTSFTGSDKMQVNVNVEWNSRSGRRSASYITYFTRRGVNDYYLN